MGLFLNPNNRLFQDVLNGQFYVDKTELALFMNERIGTPQKFVCVSRPRRFGKSVDADMLVAYYTKGADSLAQFEGLAVSHDPHFKQHLNAYDTIKIDVQRIADMTGASPEDIPKAMTDEVLAEVRAAWPHAVPEDCASLAKALELVAVAKGSGFMIVVDEWDCVMRLARDNATAQRSYLDFLRGLFKGSGAIEACYMTGILPIKKYGAHSALNLFTEYSMTDPDVLAHLMGFNADEVKRLCARFSKDYSEISDWYDGYLLGLDRIHVYNPRSVSGAMTSAYCRSFWTSTETYEALSAYIDIDFDGVTSDLVAMLDGQHVLAEVGLFENDMVTFKSKDDVYTLLVHLGYLGYDQVERAVFIPNEEIRREFANAVRAGGRPQLAALIRDSRELQRRTLEGDCSYVSDAVERAHASAAGPHYYNDEQALRAAVKLAYIWSIDDYLRVDELPGGRGYADVAFIPKPSSSLPPMVIELKWDKNPDAALEQIRARKYPAALADLEGDCVLVGITYDSETCRHSCEIERIRL